MTVSDSTPHPGLPVPSGQDAGFAFGLTVADVKRFRDILSRECGEVLSLEAAWTRAIELLALFRMLLGPLPEDHSG